MKLLSVLLIVLLMVVPSYADVVRMPSFSDIKYPQRCENLCEVLKQRLIGVSDKEKQERLLRDYDECKASYDKAINSNSQNSWCVRIYISPCRSACRIKCGSAMCSKRRRRHQSYWSEICSAEARKECQEKGEKRCAECKEREKESWHTYLHEYLLKEETPKEITSLPEQSPNNTDTK